MQSGNNESVLLGIELMQSLKGPLFYSFMRHLMAKDAYIMRCIDYGMDEGLKKLEHKELMLYEDRLLNRPESPLGAGFGELRKLEKVTINRHKVTALPDNIEQLDRLQELDLSHNLISELPASIGDLPKLLKLNLSDNRLEPLPEEFCELPKLWKLNLSYNRLKHLPSNLGKLKNLDQLNLEHNKLVDLPKSIWGLDMYRIEMAHNPFFKEIPKGYHQKKKIYQANFAYCRALEQLPSDIFDPFPLSVLNLAHTGVKKLPDGFKIKSHKYVRLTHHINLSYTPIKHLPKGLLEYDFGGNKLALTLNLTGTEVPQNEINYLEKRAGGKVKIEY